MKTGKMKATRKANRVPRSTNQFCLSQTPATLFLLRASQLHLSLPGFREEGDPGKERDRRPQDGWPRARSCLGRSKSFCDSAFATWWELSGSAAHHKAGVRDHRGGSVRWSRGEKSCQPCPARQRGTPVPPHLPLGGRGKRRGGEAMDRSRKEARGGN
jgi:hypothetical protein